MCDSKTRPAFIEAGETARVEFIMTDDSQRVENVLYFRKGGGWTIGAIADLATSAANQWKAHMASVISDTVYLVLVRATNVETADSFQTEFACDATYHGTQAGTPLPNNVTVVTKFTSGVTGRSNRGRAYLVGLTISMISSSSLVNTTVRDAITGAWRNLTGGIQEDTGGQHVIVSYCAHKVWRELAQVTNVTDYSTNMELDSQRRRLIGRGL